MWVNREDVALQTGTCGCMATTLTSPCLASVTTKVMFSILPLSYLCNNSLKAIQMGYYLILKDSCEVLSPEDSDLVELGHSLSQTLAEAAVTFRLRVHSVRVDWATRSGGLCDQAAQPSLAPSTARPLHQGPPFCKWKLHKEIVAIFYPRSLCCCQGKWAGVDSCLGMFGG